MVNNKKPNIVFVLTDDQGYGDLSCNGNPILKTPNIDNLYNESAHFTDFHVGPTCAPSRAGLLTGHYANSTGVWHTVGGRSLLRKDEWTIATALKENGYSTGIFGKWHLGDSSPYLPHERGFDKAIIHGGGGISQTPDFWGNDYFDDTYSVNGIPTKFSGYCTDVFFNEAKKFILECNDKPFFCYISLNAPHGPHNVDTKYSDKYLSKTSEYRAKYYGMIENIDENVGKMRSFLKDNNIDDNTIFIFMTDNGTAAGITTDKDGFVTDGYNYGMRGGKGSPYDGGHRVPFFLYWKDGGIDTSFDINDLTANVDFMPTILDICGIKAKDNIKFHGISLYPLLKHEKMDIDDRVIVTDSQRICTPIKWKDSAVCSKKWRLINGKELYDIKNDKEERYDISKQYPDVVKDLRNHYDDWWDIVSPKFGEMIPFTIGTGDIRLTAHDARNMTSTAPWQQKQIREGFLSTGVFEVDVVKKSTYVIELRRWPREIDTPISSKIDEEKDIYFESKFISKNDWSWYKGSVAIPIHSASLRIQDKAYSSIVNDTDTCVKFSVPLEKGVTTLEAAFIGNTPKVMVTPYFIYISEQL